MVADPILSYAARATEKDGDFPWRWRLERDQYVIGVYLERRRNDTYECKLVGLFIQDASLRLGYTLMGGKLFDNADDPEPLPLSADLCEAAQTKCAAWNNAVRALSWWAHADDMSQMKYGPTVAHDLATLWQSMWEGGNGCRTEGK